MNGFHLEQNSEFGIGIDTSRTYGTLDVVVAQLSQYLDEFESDNFHFAYRPFYILKNGRITNKLGPVQKSHTGRLLRDIFSK